MINGNFVELYSEFLNGERGITEYSEQEKVATNKKLNKIMIKDILMQGEDETPVEGSPEEPAEEVSTEEVLDAI